ncbi:MAG: AAA family ATPase [Gammaproteobacteria bacterium]|nr:AAA family ATPase [Gammaproteobacteria bacterium]NIR82019.1 AAA family ATPase [Gammaproteobacteria bacterium]NIR89247.1 AAA family ATPase [Gammaproteobacteria bacterium]NIU03129.1 AAA family ATPase [Gammaproteobacteria bacterium]NIV50645.1 AAA family ATPase [Gammaproteobacteria bacterium]
MTSIREWLDSIGLAQYAETFEENVIGWDVLSRLDHSLLKDIGVRAAGDRVRILNAIESLHAQDEKAEAALQPVSSGQDSPSGGAERRQLTVMFCDLVGSTELAHQLDPEDLGDLISRYQRAAGRAVDRYDGFIARYVGDGMLIYFGFPRAHEDDAARAVYAGLEIVAQMRELNADLSEEVGRTLAVRIGIATGQVVVGALIGKGASQEATVLGAAPNLAARLQTLAEPNTVIVAQTTRDLTSSLFEYVERGPSKLKGFKEFVRAWRVVGADALRHHVGARGAKVRTPLVGRKDEVGLLIQRWAQATEGDGQVVMLSGEPGIGKSRIVHELSQRLYDQPHVEVHYYCSPFHQASALHPFIRQLERAACFSSDDTHEEQLDKLERLIGRWSDHPKAHVPLMAALLSIPTDPRYPALDLLPAAQRQKTLDALEAQLKGLAMQQPVLVILEDAHWIDPTSLELLKRLIDAVETLCVLLVVTFRPEFTPQWTRSVPVTLLALNHLSRRQCAEMVEKLAAGKPFSQEILAEIVSRTQGIPLFVEELTKSLLESGKLEKEARHALAPRELASVIPATLQDSLMARLDRLGEVKKLAQIGAAIGRLFNYELLREIAGLPENTLHEGLDRLERTELVARRGSPPNATYAFKHALVQEVAYESLLKKTRRGYHEAIAEALERPSRSIAETEPELLAHHYTEAALSEEAIKYWLLAGEKAAQRSANREAVSHLRKGLQMLETLPEGKERDERELRFLIALGPALMATRGWDAAEVEQVYDRARNLARHTAHVEALFPAIWGLWLVAHAGGDAPTARRLYDELFALVGEEKDSMLLLQAHHAGGSTMCSDGKLHRAQHHIDEGIALYRMDAHAGQALHYGGHDPCVCAYSLGALNQLMLGHLDRARSYSEQATILAKEVEHSPSLAHGYWYRAELCQICGEAEEAGQRAKTVYAVATEKGMAQYAAWAMMTRGWVLAANGHAQEGIAEVEKGLATLRANRTRYHLPHRLAMRAQTFFLAGEIGAAADAIEEALSATAETGERWFEAEVYRLKAEFQLAQPHADHALAELCLRKAMEAARSRDAKFWELRAALSLARLWRDQGKAAQSRELLAPLLAWFTEGFDARELREARTFLRDLPQAQRGM